jgi:uncharacterized protein YggT (Ycf19 family)
VGREKLHLEDVTNQLTVHLIILFVAHERDLGSLDFSPLCSLLILSFCEKDQEGLVRADSWGLKNLGATVQILSLLSHSPPRVQSQGALLMDT